MVECVVIDSNMLQDKALEEFLAESTGNFAVLPDFTWIEMYKQQSLSGVTSAFSVIRHFPDRLVALKSGGEIAALDPSEPRLVPRMLRSNVATDMVRMLEAIDLAEQGAPSALQAFDRQWATAAGQMEDLLLGASELAQSLPEIAEIFTADEIRRCRTDNRYTAEMHAKIFGAADQIYETLVESHDLATDFLSQRSRFDAFLYRFALGFIIYALLWIRDGSQIPKRLDRVRNDMIDLNFAIYGTYFSGLWTNDAKAKRIYSELHSALRALGARIDNELTLKQVSL